MRSVGAQQQIFAPRPHRRLIQRCCFRNIDEFSVLVKTEASLSFNALLKKQEKRDTRNVSWIFKRGKSGKQIDFCGTPTLGRFTLKGQTESWERWLMLSTVKTRWLYCKKVRFLWSQQKRRPPSLLLSASVDVSPFLKWNVNGNIITASVSRLKETKSWKVQAFLRHKRRPWTKCLFSHFEMF